MIDLDKEDMDAVERTFAGEERAERRERVLDILSGVLTVVGALAFLALCWLLIRSREAADAERRARDPQGAAARVERRLMADDAVYRLCRRASGAVFALPERREIVHAVNVRKDMERKIAGQRAAIRALESTISQPHRGARRIAETPEAKDPPHGAVRKG